MPAKWSAYVESERMIGNHVPAKRDCGAKSPARLPVLELSKGARCWLTCGSAGGSPG
jgi:hypothetical protein